MKRALTDNHDGKMGPPLCDDFVPLMCHNECL